VKYLGNNRKFTQDPDYNNDLQATLDTIEEKRKIDKKQIKVNEQ
jgi:hypothetical protein